MTSVCDSNAVERVRLSEGELVLLPGEYFVICIYLIYTSDIFYKSMHVLIGCDPPIRQKQIKETKT